MRLIEEIFQKSEQGVTGPFLCRTDRGELAYVKGKGIGASSLRSEWIAASILDVLQLPVPPFFPVQIPKELIQFSAVRDVSSLGAGVGFASLCVEQARELSFQDLDQIDDQFKAEVLLFDWWIFNNDRYLTEIGGNPNLIIGGAPPSIWIIDHNAAFDDSAGQEIYWQRHIFRKFSAFWSDDFRANTLKAVQKVLPELPRITNEIPEEWWPNEDPDCPESKLELERIRTILERPLNQSDLFWSSIP